MRLHTALPAALLLALTGLFPPPSAFGAGTTRLGNPKMEVLTAKILPPYSPDYQLSTAVSAWPPIGDVLYLREDQKTSGGELWVAKTFNTHPNLLNRGAAMANDAGSFLSWAEARYPGSFADHVGVFSFTQWSQSFRKDSANATLKFVITGARLYAMCLTTGSRSEFAMDARAFSNGLSFFSFHQDAGLVMFGNPPFLPMVSSTSHGPMSHTDSNPDGIQRDHQQDFAGLTVTVDLSSVPLLAEFTVSYDEMTQANIAYDEVVRASAYFRDPLDDSTGVTVETAGLTPTDHPEPAPVAVAPSASVPVARLSAPWPNPSSGAVSLRLELPAESPLAVEVFDLTGRRVAVLGRGSFAPGTHALRWDAKNERGADVPAGVYLVRAVGPRVNLVRRVVRLGVR